MITAEIGVGTIEIQIETIGEEGIETAIGIESETIAIIGTEIVIEAVEVVAAVADIIVEATTLWARQEVNIRAAAETIAARGPTRALGNRVGCLCECESTRQAKLRDSEYEIAKMFNSTMTTTTTE